MLLFNEIQGAGAPMFGGQDKDWGRTRGDRFLKD